MSLTTEEALESAMSYIKDAELCLYDAYDCMVEIEDLKNIHHRLNNKLEDEVKNERISR